MIKYLGSKRRLVPVLTRLCEAAEARSALDLFTGTTRVAQAFKRTGACVTAIDTARYSEVFARAYIAIDARAVDQRALAEAVDALNAVPGEPGYFTDTFCVQARFFQPENGARVDAVRAAIERDHAGTDLHPVLLTSLIEAADRVDSTTGVQMAYVKQWAPRSFSPLTLRVPELLPGSGRARRGDALELAATLPPCDLAYLDPPYNQHRYFTNYHVWETLVAGDEPEHYGVACKRIDARDDDTKSVFNARRQMPDALATRHCRRTRARRGGVVQRRILGHGRRATRHVLGARARRTAELRFASLRRRADRYSQSERGTGGHGVARPQPGVSRHRGGPA